jgi:hypothetical protein
MTSVPPSGPSQPADLERDRVIAAMSARYVEVQYAFVRMLSEHLADTARVFGNDLELALILAVIGQSHLNALLTQPEPREGGLSYGISALRVADVTGLPRETTRRKLGKLAERGWIEQGETGWRLSGPSPVDTQARLDLSGIDQRGIERLARLHIDLTRLLATPQADAGTNTRNG